MRSVGDRATSRAPALETEGMWFIRDWDTKTWPCGWLPESLVHRLNTRLGGGFKAAWLPRQVHGRRVAVLSGSDGKQKPTAPTAPISLGFYGGDGGETQADAVVTDVPGVLIGVRTADCLPVWISDGRSSWIGIVHAGWRGIRDGVAETALETAVTLWKTEASDVIVRIGPGIRRCCYRVGEEMVADFKTSVERTQQGWFLDLAHALTQRLIAWGLPPSRISDTTVCTCCGSLYSYRRQGEAAGRHVSLAGIRPR